MRSVLLVSLLVLAASCGLGGCITAYDPEGTEFDDCPHEAEACDGIDNNCDGSIDEFCDKDGDGFCDASIATRPVGEDWPAVCPNGQGDCDDGNAAVHPGAAEICDDLNNTCGDGAVDEGCDDDGDGFCDDSMQVSANASICPLGGDDCNDDDESVNPGLAGTCN